MIPKWRDFRRLLAVGCVAVGCIFTRPAVADEGRILLIAVPAELGGWQPAEQRASAELAALGLQVQVVSGPSLGQCSDDDGTRDAIRSAGALGALELRREGEGYSELRVCVVELVTGKATLRHLEISRGLRPAQAALLAVELVHASLLEVRAPHPSRGQVTAPQQITRTVDRQLARPVLPWLGVRLGGGVFGTPGGVSPSFAPLLGLAIRPTPRVAFEADGALGLMPGAASRETGSAEVRLGVARLHGLYSPWKFERATIALGAGVGFAAARVTGQATSPYRSENSVATTWLASGALGTSLSLTRQWWLRLDAHLGWAPDPVTVAFAGAARVELGRPLLDAGLALEWLAFR